MVLFKGWVDHPVLQQIWEQSKRTYGKRFAHFWDDVRLWEVPEDLAKVEQPGAGKAISKNPPPKSRGVKGKKD